MRCHEYSQPQRCDSLAKDDDPRAHKQEQLENTQKTNTTILKFPQLLTSGPKLF
jgi:hypothetical protein